MLTSSTPNTCSTTVSRLAAMQHVHLGQRTSAFRYLLCAGAVSLARLYLIALQGDLLGHVYRPDAGPAPNVEDAGRLPVLRNRRLVQLLPPCDSEELVVDVHAVFFRLVAREHVDSAPEAMIPAAVFEVVAVGSRHGQTGTVSDHWTALLLLLAAVLVRVQVASHRAGARRAALTHSMPS